MSFDLSEAARRMLESDGPALVLGGPGSGKTTLSLLKAQRLIPSLAPGQEVLFLSFSRAAVHQVAIRCKDVLSAEERRLIAVKTYHAFCMEVLRVHGRLLTGSPPRILFPRNERLTRAAHDGDWETERRRLAAEEGVFAFDEFASSAAELIERAACVRALLADRYPIIILDEFQDTNDAQWALVQQLSRASRIIVLADPDQRIFEYDSSVDPRRLDQLRETVPLTEFDLGTENHRSPGGGILGFADAVLRNRPLPNASEVACRSFWPNNMDGTVHAAIVWLLAALRESGVPNPSVAILCRTNSLVLRLSETLNRENTYNGTTYRPVEHSVMWDAELSAAAAVVVASILEWPGESSDTAAATTLGAIADFYDIKNSVKPSNSARSTAATFRNSVESITAGKKPRSKAGKAIVAASNAGATYTGSPVQDWKSALATLDGVDQLSEVQRHSRLVRLFRASGEIGPQLSEQWLTSGTYGGAREIVRRAIDRATLLSVRSDPRGVVLMTMHKSKGKEFDGVVLVEGAHVSPFLNTKWEEPPYHESRRLLRVGITRARNHVVILRPNDALPLVGSYG
jgi:DNA helicase II / ATP-dependent DNA helicase PcrA